MKKKVKIKKKYLNQLNIQQIPNVKIKINNYYLIIVNQINQNKFKNSII